MNSDSVAVFKHRLACVNFSYFLLIGHLLVLFKRQPLCPACFLIFIRINDDEMRMNVTVDLYGVSQRASYSSIIITTVACEQLG